MTPKEKANRIRYQLESEMQGADMRGHYNQAVKQCALIAVDLLIDCTPSVNIYPPNFQSLHKGLREYWQQVKQEIEKL